MICYFGVSCAVRELVGERSNYGEDELKGLLEWLEVRMPVWVAWKSSENLDRRISKVSPATFVDGGLVGPKLSPDLRSGVGNGQQVDIPVL